MPRTNAPLYSFNAGEVSKTALARVDAAKLRMAAECQLNWLPFVTGAMMNRPGLEFKGEIQSDNPALLLDFIYAKTDTALIELTANVMRVWTVTPGNTPAEALVSRASVTTAILDPTFTGTGGHWVTSDTTAGTTITLGAIAGVDVTFSAVPIGGLARVKQTFAIGAGDFDGLHLHAVRVVVGNGPVTVRVGSTDGLADYVASTVLDTGTFSLAFTPTTANASIQIESTDTCGKTVVSATIESAGVMTLPTPWGAADLPNLRWIQSQDVIYVACYGQQQQMIQRNGVRPQAQGWGIAVYRSADGPFHGVADVPNLVLTPSAQTGNITVSASLPFFTAAHVGALLRIFTGAQLNTAVLGGANAYSVPIRVTGIGTDRDITFQVTNGPSGAWVGTMSVQRSLVSADTGFVDLASTDPGWASVPSFTGNFSIVFDDNGISSPGDSYDNVIAWYRFGFKSGNYTSGSATVQTLYTGGGAYGIARITAYTSPLLVSAEVLAPFTGNVVFPGFWQISDWCAAFGWPTSVVIHEGRVGWFSGGTIPFALSGSDDYTSFAEEDNLANSLGDAGAILTSFGSGPSDSINFSLSLTRLLLGREQSIASARASNFDQALTPTDIVIRDCSQQGADRLRAVKAGKRALYVQQSGRRVFELVFNAQEFDYDDRDLTRLNLDIGKPGFVDIAYQVQPDGMLWLPRADGQVAALLYDVKDEVEAWWRLQTLGVVENVRVLPSTGIEDSVYFVVQRVINGVTRRFLEKLALRDNCKGGAINQMADCHLVYTGIPVSIVQLPWLPNTTVTVWADGSNIGTATTNNVGTGIMPDVVAAAFTNGATAAGNSTLHFAATPAAVAAGQVITDPSAAAVITPGTTVLSKTSTTVTMSANVSTALSSRGVLNGDLINFGGAHSYIVAGLGGAVVQSGIIPGGTTTVSVPSAYDGYPAELFADQYDNGKPVHMGVAIVAGGAVTLPYNMVATTITALIGHVAPFMSAKLAYAAGRTSALTIRKRVDHVGLVMFDATVQALSVGQRFDVLDGMPLMENGEAVAASTLWSEYDEPAIELPGEWNTDARLCLLAQAPNPVTIGAVVVGVNTEAR